MGGNHAWSVVGTGGGFALRVGDVGEARAELEAKGVEFVAETWDSGVCHFAARHDPDGNTVILHRRYAPRNRANGRSGRLRQCA